MDLEIPAARTILKASETMKEKSIINPFGAPVYYQEAVSSTMEESRLLAARGEAHGTVIVADFQEQGRGRAGRPWLAARGQNLFFTILLRFACFKAIPRAITLRTGLAVSLAIEDFAPPLRGQVKVKWPNDIMLFSKKTAGILTESDSSLVYIGIGINVFQREFPAQLKAKATSILIETERAGQSGNTDRERGRDILLGHILARLYTELTADRADWRSRLEERLFKKDERVRFTPGLADSPLKVEGALRGIDPDGGLIIETEGDKRLFTTGELDVYGESERKL
ncbi:MAG: biotin--[acetyl-CoA-carboxylase] ligase [Treponema sp.]|jgi:BirA family biotin operon repressor/biotin-[acetyl-CoA-carboxylase] ligase|nr:biotin--[acetyl-CoA-carboxylase] ligase [Treponema sp.]